MLNRRSFLQSVFATVPGLHCLGATEEPPPHSPNTYERLVAMQQDSLDILGRPRSWELVRDGFHPISPERIVVLGDKVGGGRENSNMRKCLGCDLYPRKVDSILHLAHVMTDYYQAPNLFPDWAIRTATEDAFVAAGHGFGLLHQFRNDGLVRLVNHAVDWWLFLFPGGVDWESWEPVFAIVGHVFAPTSPALKMRVWQLTTRVGWRMESDSWSWLTEVDRVTAAQAVNLSILLEMQATAERNLS